VQTGQPNVPQPATKVIRTTDFSAMSYLETEVDVWDIQAAELSTVHAAQKARLQ